MGNIGFDGLKLLLFSGCDFGNAKVLGRNGFWGGAYFFGSGF